jgi:hypothetical protein
LRGHSHFSDRIAAITGNRWQQTKNAKRTTQTCSGTAAVDCNDKKKYEKLMTHKVGIRVENKKKGTD